MLNRMLNQLEYGFSRMFNKSLKKNAKRLFHYIFTQASK